MANMFKQWFQQRNRGVLMHSGAGRSGLTRQTSAIHFEEQVRSVWLSADSVVYKDLPRLAKRIQVESPPGVIVYSTSSTAMAKYEQDMEAWHTEDMYRELFMHFLGESLPQESETRKWLEEHAVPGLQRHVLSLREKPRAMHHDSIKNMQVPDSRKLGTVLMEVITTIAQHLEPPEVCAQLPELLAPLVVDEVSDYELALAGVFEQFPGKTSSATFKVFKAIHQAAIFPAILCLRETFSQHLGVTKDVRTPQGWRVLIELGEMVAITHFRVEQCIDLTNPEKNFEFEWQMRLCFDKELKDLQAVQLKVVEINFLGEISEEDKKVITDDLMEELIVQ